MPVPSPRNSIRIARGNYADLAANATEIGEGELCFAIDQDKFYSKAGSTLIPVGGGTELYSIAQIGDVDVAGAVNGQVLVYNASEGKWVPADQSGGGGQVDSVNGQVGVVVLDASDVGALASGDNVSELNNDAGYITAAEAPVQPDDLFSGDYNDLTNKPTIPPAYDDTALSNRVTANEGDITQLQSDLTTKADLVNGVVPNSQLPSVAITEYLGQAADEAEMLALDGQKGDWAIRTDTSTTWVVTGEDSSQLASWTELATPPAGVSSVNGYTGTVVLSAADVGALASGDNVSELTNDAGYITDPGVSQIIAGTNVTIDPVGGTGAVTINATGGGGGGVPEAPIDGQLYARQDADWSVINAATGVAGGADAWGQVTSAGVLTAGSGCTVSKTDKWDGSTVANATGVYYITFNTEMPSANYSVAGSITEQAFWDVTTVEKDTRGFTVNIIAPNVSSGANVFGDASFDFQVAGAARNGLLGGGADAWGAIAQNGDVEGNFNVADVVLNSAGNYTVSFTNPMPNVNYSVLATPRVTGGVRRFIGVENKTVNGFDVFTANGDNTPTSVPFSFSVFATDGNSGGFWVKAGDELEPLSATADVKIGGGEITLSADGSGSFAGTVNSSEQTIGAGWDLSAGNFWYCSGGIAVPNPINATAGTSGLIRLTAAPTGWGSNIKHPGGSAETISSFPAMVPFYVQDASTILLGKATQGIA